LQELADALAAFKEDMINPKKTSIPSKSRKNK
jgi:hypothetical protein